MMSSNHNAKAGQISPVFLTICATYSLVRGPCKELPPAGQKRHFECPAAGHRRQNGRCLPSRNPGKWPELAAARCRTLVKACCFDEKPKV